MSTASLPTPEPTEAASPAGAGGAASDADGWMLLDNLRRRLDDQAVQTRKTQLQVAQLADSIGALVDVQRRRSRWLNLNSFVAYVIFTILCGSGFYLLYRSRASDLVDAREHADHERDAAVRRADEAVGKLAQRDLGEARAWEIYELLDKGKPRDALAKLNATPRLPLSRTENAMLVARAKETEVAQADAAIKSAVAALRAGRNVDAIKTLEAALPTEAPGPRATTMHYWLGIAYARTDKLDKAVAHLQPAVDADVDQEDARYQLANALDRNGAYAKARAEYDRYATAHPQSPNALFALRRSATLARMPPQGPPDGAAKPIVPVQQPQPPAQPPQQPPQQPAAPRPAVQAPAAPPVAPKPTAQPPAPTTTPGSEPPPDG